MGLLDFINAVSAVRWSFTRISLIAASLIKCQVEEEDRQTGEGGGGKGEREEERKKEKGKRRKEKGERRRRRRKRRMGYSKQVSGRSVLNDTLRTQRKGFSLELMKQQAADINMQRRQSTGVYCLVSSVFTSRLFRAEEKRHCTYRVGQKT